MLITPACDGESEFWQHNLTESTTEVDIIATASSFKAYGIDIHDIILHVNCVSGGEGGNGTACNGTLGRSATWEGITVSPKLEFSNEGVDKFTMPIALSESIASIDGDFDWPLDERSTAPVHGCHGAM